MNCKLWFDTDHSKSIKSEQGLRAFFFFAALLIDNSGITLFLGTQFEGNWCLKFLQLNFFLKASSKDKLSSIHI